MTSTYHSAIDKHLESSGFGLGILRASDGGFRFGWESNRFIGTHNGLRENKKLVHLVVLHVLQIRPAYGQTKKAATDVKS